MNEQSKNSPGGPPVPSSAIPGHRLRGLLRRYLISMVIGAVLVVSVEMPIHAWEHRGERKEQQERTESLTHLNGRVLGAPKAARPWDIAGSFYRRITSGTYSPTVLSLAEPFRWDERVDLRKFSKKMHELDRENFDWATLRADRPAWSFPGANPVGFVLGMPDGIIFTIRRVYSGGWINVAFNVFALLGAIPVALWLKVSRTGTRSWWAVILFFPMIASLCGAVLWAVMWLATHVFVFLSLPAASIWAMLLPALGTAALHTPLTAVHKAIEEGTERASDPS